MSESMGRRTSSPVSHLLIHRWSDDPTRCIRRTDGRSRGVGGDPPIWPDIPPSNPPSTTDERGHLTQSVRVTCPTLLQGWAIRRSCRIERW